MTWERNKSKKGQYEREHLKHVNSENGKLNKGSSGKEQSGKGQF